MDRKLFSQAKVEDKFREVCLLMLGVGALPRLSVTKTTWYIKQVFAYLGFISFIFAKAVGRVYSNHP